MKKKILIIGTGGTIASREGESGLVPAADVSELLAYVPEAERMCEIQQLQVFSLDSTNIQPYHWIELVKCIHEHYDTYDGFLILHGTDSMAYTAAALSYLIQKSRIPIVLPGSQLPMESKNTDAIDNVYQSIRYLLNDRACDVSIVFAGKIIPGGRARKVRSRSMNAFTCVGYECDAGKRTVYTAEKPEFYFKLNPKVLLWKLIPGLQSDVLLQLAEYFDGIVIEGFGLGGLPDIQDNSYFPVIRKLTDAGKTVAITIQVPLEGSDMSVYEVGVKYKTLLPVLEGGTMTPEAMVVKLMWILGQEKDPEAIRSLFYQSINYDIVDGFLTDWYENGGVF